MTGVIIYEGPSLIDGAPIVAIATGLGARSRNEKTGGVIQTWILRADCEPHVAAKDGRDVSICGQCMHRADANGKRTCYVVLHQAPLAVFRAYQRGSYTYMSPEIVGEGRTVRLGSYGDPAAVPSYVWGRLLRRAAGWTGYTHQRNHPLPRVRRNAERLKRWCMASADSIEDAQQAHADSWRTFRVLPATGGTHLPSERVCPASAEAGKLTNCEACRACSGVAGRGHSSITIRAHGRGAGLLSSKLLTV